MSDFLDENWSPDGYSDDDLEGILGEKLPPRASLSPNNGLPAPRSIGTKELQRRVDAAYKTKITVIGEHSSYDMPLSVRCEECGDIVHRKPRSLMKGSWIKCSCPRPKGNRRKSRKK